MISVNNLSYYIGGRPLYLNSSLHLNERDRAGLIGMNGSGKTTLLKILQGEIRPDQGEVSMNKEHTVGELRQEISERDETRSILTIAMEAFQPLLDLKSKMDKLVKEIETDPSDRNIEKLSTHQTEFELKGGYAMQSRAEEILEGIGFRTSDLERPLSAFSGGWKMRVELARLLLKKPSLLLLDEPTNHLDLPSIQWFENYIRNYEGAVVIVSHDRSFLDNTVNKIIEIDHNELITYPGNYSQYQKDKQERMEIRNNAHANQQKKLKDAEKFINRFRAKATKARQVQSKIKLMDKIELIEKADDDVKTIQFEFRFTRNSGKHVLDIDRVSKSYGETEIFRDTSAEIIRGDKIALIGANGLGKTTLLKMMGGDIDHSGRIDKGHHVIEAYYAQHQVDALHYENTVLEELSLEDSDYTELELRSLLGSFLFSGDDVFKKISVLSGGEKARIALAKTLISKANFLILDEPTNHLDLYSVDILQQALKKYQGTLIMVSHDRDFINEVADKIWYIEDKKVKEYPGTLDEYMFWYNNLRITSERKEKTPVRKKKPETASHKNREMQKEQKKKVKYLQRDMTILEEKIHDLEKEQGRIEEEMALPEVYADFGKLSELTGRLDSIKKSLEQLNQDWERTYLELDQLDNSSG